MMRKAPLNRLQPLLLLMARTGDQRVLGQVNLIKDEAA